MQTLFITLLDCAFIMPIPTQHQRWEVIFFMITIMLILMI